MLTQAQLIDPQARTLNVKIKRYNPELDEKPRWEEFQVEADVDRPHFLRRDAALVRQDVGRPL